ncbi:MAG: hypothetical protein ACRCZZ_07165 [Phocaeicola sp.]
MGRLVSINRNLFIEVSIEDFEKYTIDELVDRFHRRQNRENNDCVKYRGGYLATKCIPIEELEALKRGEITASSIAKEHGVSVTTVRNNLKRSGL